MQPTVNDGSLLIVSTVQALWDPSKKELQEDSIIGKLNEQYGISEVYLQGTNWHNVKAYKNDEGVDVPAGQVNFEAVSEPMKGTTIYVYGDLVSGGDQEASPENEVWVFHQNAESRTFNEGYKR